MNTNHTIQDNRAGCSDGEEIEKMSERSIRNSYYFVTILSVSLLLISVAFFSNVEGTKNIDLGDLDKTFIGETKSSYAGYSISGAGDVNGDGFDDFLIGAYENSESGYRAGKSYLIFGNKSRYAHHIKLSDAGASFKGEKAGDNSGYSVSGAGDVNGDGYDDFLIGAPYKDYSGDNDVGKVYLFYGMKHGWKKDVSLSTANATFVGHLDDDRAGRSVSGAGDVNGDGYDDILIGAPDNDINGDRSGQVYVIFGKSSKMTHSNFRLNSADASYEGELSGDIAGFAISDAGDVNNDGYDDFVIGAPHAERYTSDRVKGKVYLIYGMKTGWKMNTDLSKANASFWGSKNLGKSGYSVSGAGDVNADGYDDFLAGEPFRPGGGRFYLFLGGNSSWIRDGYMYHSDTAFNESTYSYDNIGISLSGLGDINGDGFDDFIAGADEDDDGGTDAGKCFIIHGRSSWPPIVDLSKANVTFTGEKAGDHAGRSVSGAGDFNNDGNPDIIVGAYQNDDGGSQSGKVYLHFYKLPLPKIRTVDKLYASEDSYYSLIYNATDTMDDYSDLYWIMKTEANWLSFDPSSLKLEGTPTNDDVGSAWVNISVTNTFGGLAFSNFTLTVRNINDPPEILTEVDYNATEDMEYYSNFEAVDIDPTEDELTWSIDSNSDWLDIDKETGILSGTPENDDVGSHWVNISVDDGNWASDHVNFTVEVANVNDDPVITSANIETTNEDQIYLVDYDAEDIDPTIDVLEWSMITNADFLTMNNVTGVLTGTPDDSDIGTWDVEISVQDGKGGINKTEFDLSVSNINDIPQILDSPVSQIMEDTPYYFNMTFTDDDPAGLGDHHVWSISENDFLMIDNSSGEITGMPNNSHVGSHLITVWISDSKGGKDELSFEIEVLNRNDPPIIKDWETVPTLVLEDELVNIDLDVEDIDPEGSGDVIMWKFSKPTDAAFLTIDPESGKITGAPSNDDLGSWIVNVSVEDGMGGQDWFTFTLGVKNVNDDPIILTLEIPDLEQDEVMSLGLEAMDIDPTDDVLTWIILDTNGGFISLDPSKGILSGTPTNDDVGTIWIALELEDGNGGSAIFNYTFVVMNVNDPPHIVNDPGRLTMKEDGSFSLDLGELFGDIDGDDLTYSHTPIQNAVIELKDGELLITPTPNWNGELHFTLIAKDGSKKASIDLVLNVQNINDPPMSLSITCKETYLEGEIIRLSGEALDHDITQGDELIFIWMSEPAGLQMEGEEIETLLSPGNYTIYLKVTDSSGAENTTSISIKVNSIPEEIDDDAESSPNILIIIVIISVMILLIVGVAVMIFIMFNRSKSRMVNDDPEEDEISEKSMN